MNNANENVKKVKEEILQAAYNVFLEKGYSKTNLNEIAAMCNTSRTPIYYHFKDKENLHRMALNMLLDKMNNRIDNILYSNKPLYERFDTLIDFFIKHSNELYRWQMDLQNGSPQSSIDVYKNFLNLQYAKFESVISIERVKRQQDFKISSKSLATILYLLSNGFFLAIHQNLLKIDLDIYRESLKELVDNTL